MSISLQRIPTTTARQDSRKAMIEHYCRMFGLNFHMECFSRFHKTFDDLSPEQIRTWLGELGERRGRQLKNKQG
jgi:hypothetical protein